MKSLGLPVTPVASAKRYTPRFGAQLFVRGGYEICDGKHSTDFQIHPPIFANNKPFSPTDGSNTPD